MTANLPKPQYDKSQFTTDWKLDEFIKELNKRSIEFTLGVDGTTRDTSISFNIRHRKKDKDIIKALLRALFGTVKQG